MHLKDSSDRPNYIKPLLLMLIAALLVLGVWFSIQSRQPSAPAQSTTESRPNSEQNIPDKGNGSVTQDGNPNEDATPDPAGTGGNTMLEQR